MSPAISPAALEGSAPLNQEAAGTKGPLRVQRGVAAAPCLIPAYLLSAGFIVPPGFNFTASPSTTAAIKPRGLQLGIKCRSGAEGGAGALTGKVLGTSLLPCLGREDREHRGPRDALFGEGRSGSPFLQGMGHHRCYLPQIPALIPTCPSPEVSTEPFTNTAVTHEVGIYEGGIN